MDDEKYTIYPYEPNLEGSKLKLGQQVTLCYDGGWADLNGPYCCWPKSEPRQFVVSEWPENSIDIIEPMQTMKVLDKFVEDVVPFYQKLNKKRW